MVVPEDVKFLREVAELLRIGRVGDLVHWSWPQRVGELADRIEESLKRGDLR